MHLCSTKFWTCISSILLEKPECCIWLCIWNQMHLCRQLFSMYTVFVLNFWSHTVGSCTGYCDATVLEQHLLLAIDECTDTRTEHTLVDLHCISWVLGNWHTEMFNTHPWKCFANRLHLVLHAKSRRRILEILECNQTGHLPMFHDPDVLDNDRYKSKRPVSPICQ